MFSKRALLAINPLLWIAPGIVAVRHAAIT